MLFGLMAGGLVGGCRREKLVFSKAGGSWTAQLSYVAWSRYECSCKIHQLVAGEAVAQVGQRTGGKGKKMVAAYAVYMYTDAPRLSDGSQQELRIWSGSQQRATAVQTQINRFFYGNQLHSTCTTQPGHASAEAAASPTPTYPASWQTNAKSVGHDNGRAPPALASAIHGQKAIQKHGSRGLWGLSSAGGAAQTMNELTDWPAYHSMLAKLKGGAVVPDPAKATNGQGVQLSAKDTSQELIVYAAMEAASMAVEQLLEEGRWGSRCRQLWAELTEVEELLLTLLNEQEIEETRTKRAYRGDMQETSIDTADARLVRLQLQNVILELSTQLQTMAAMQARPQIVELVQPSRTGEMTKSYPQSSLSLSPSLSSSQSMPEPELAPEPEPEPEPSLPLQPSADSESELPDGVLISPPAISPRRQAPSAQRKNTKKRKPLEVKPNACAPESEPPDGVLISAAQLQKRKKRKPLKVKPKARVKPGPRPGPGPGLNLPVKERRATAARPKKREKQKQATSEQKIEPEVYTEDQMVVRVTGDAYPGGAMSAQDRLEKRKALAVKRERRGRRKRTPTRFAAVAASTPEDPVTVRQAPELRRKPKSPAAGRDKRKETQSLAQLRSQLLAKRTPVKQEHRSSRVPASDRQQVETP
jgi:hypothetical protein